MAQDRAGLKTYQDLRDHLEKVEVLAVLELLRSIQNIEAKTVPGDEQTSQIERALRSFLDKTNPFELQRVVTSLQTLSFIRGNASLRNTWKYFVDVNGDPAGFFTEDNFKNSASLTYLYTYLSLSVSELESQITVISSEIKKEAEEQKQKLSSAASAISASAKQSEKQLSETEIREQNERKIREDQQKSVERAKQAFLRYQVELARINGLLPPGRQLSETDFLNLAKLASDSSFAPLNIDTFFERYGLTRMVGNDKVALSALKQYFISLRYKHLQLRQEQGLSAKVFASEQMQEAVSGLTRVYGDRAVMLAYSATGKQLKEMETKSDGSKDVDVQLAREIRSQSLGTLWQPDKGAVSLIKNFTGQTKRAREEFLRDIGLITDETSVTERPRLFEEFLGRADNLSVLDMVGTNEEEPLQTFEGEEAPSDFRLPRQVDPATVKRNSNRLSALARDGKLIASNPALIGAIGGGAAAGLTIYSLATNLAVGVSTGAGAIGGAIIGQALIPIPFLGAGIGAAVGAVAGNAVGNAVFAGPSVGLPIGVSAPTIGGIAQAAGAGIAPTATAGVSALGTGAANVASATLGATQGFLNALPSLQSPLSGAFGSIGVVAGPLVVTGVIAAVVVVPAMFGAFLGPEGLIMEGESKYVEVVKTVLPAANPVPLITKYTITIKPKTDAQGQPYNITINSAEDSYRLTSRGKPQAPAPPDLSSLNGQLPAEGRVFEYTVDYPVLGGFEDTRVTNTLKITFDVSGSENQVGQTASTFAAVAFGNPPSDIACLEFGPGSFQFDKDAVSETWKEADKQKIIAAFTPMANYQTYLDLLCANGNVTLYRLPYYNQYGGFAPAAYKNKVGIYDRGIIYTINSARYTLIHELGHVINWQNPKVYLNFVSAGVTREGLLRTYPIASKKSAGEDFAETIALYTVHKTYSFCFADCPPTKRESVNMEQEYPLHFSWVRDNIFGGLPPPQ